MAETIEDLATRLLVRDRAAHTEAVDRLAATGDERAIPYLFEVAVIDAIANDWGSFGFPEVLRDHDAPRYLDLPEVAWPGVIDALGELAEPDFSEHHAWVQWESWYSQQSYDLPTGFDAWKLQLYRSYLPPVGALLDVEPRAFELDSIRWGNTDRSFLAALNAPSFTTARAADGYLEPDDHVFGFTVSGQPYAVPRWLLFPHELSNFALGGHTLSLTYCTLCNAPILYDRTVDGRTLTFGSTGMLLNGNKVMFDEETESLWSQHRGTPLAGPHLERGSALEARPITQTDWADWVAAHPDTQVLDRETGFDLEYEHYQGNVGFFEHYWTREDVVQPGVTRAETELSEKASVYGVTGERPGSIRVYPVDAVRAQGFLVDTFGERSVVVLTDATDDVAVYEAPEVPLEREGGTIIDGTGRRWTITRDALEADGTRLERVDGRHGLWFAFRTQYPDATVVTGGS